MMPSWIVCIAYTYLLRIYAFTIVIKSCLPPADRHIAAVVSWCPHANLLVSLSSHPSFSGSVPSVSLSFTAACLTQDRRPSRSIYFNRNFTGGQTYQSCGHRAEKFQIQGRGADKISPDHPYTPLLKRHYVMCNWWATPGTGAGENDPAPVCT